MWEGTRPGPWPWPPPLSEMTHNCRPQPVLPSTSGLEESFLTDEIKRWILGWPCGANAPAGHRQPLCPGWEAPPSPAMPLPVPGLCLHWLPGLPSVMAQPLLSLWPCTDRDSGFPRHSSQGLARGAVLAPWSHGEQPPGCPGGSGSEMLWTSNPTLGPPRGPAPCVVSSEQLGALPKHLPQSPLLQSVRPPAIQGPF